MFQCRQLAQRPSLLVAGVPRMPRYFESESVRRQRVWPILDGQVADSREPEYPRSWQLGGLIIMVAYGGAELTAYFGVSVYTWLASARS